MSVKLISGTRIDKPTIPQSTKAPEASSLARNIVLPITGAVGAIPKVAENVYNIGKSIVSNQEPSRFYGTPENLRENIAAPLLGVTKESLEPKGSAEQILDMIYGDLPLIALSGGASTGVKLASSLGKSAAVSSSIKGAEKLGFGPIGQIIGGLIGGKTAGTVAGKLNNFYTGNKAVGGLRPYLETAKNEAYGNADKLFKGAKGNFAKTDQKLNQFIQSTQRGISTKSKDIVYKKLSEAVDKVHNGQLSLADAIDLKQDFNDLAYKSDYDKKATGMFKQAARYFKDFIEEEGAKHPEAYKSYVKGEDLHKILNADREVKNLISDYFNPASFTKNGILKTLFKSSLGAAGALPGLETAKFFIRRPEARKYYADVFKNVIKDNKPEAVNALRKIVKLADKEVAQEKKSEPKEGSIKLLKGKKLTH